MNSGERETMKRTTALILASTLAFACGDAANTDKGAEENPLTNGKDDSFFRPTEHGELRMDIANPATMKTDELFHSWTFELGGDAQVDLKTEVSKNLDTVMYLYHRTSPSDSWGRYIKKNDDDGDKISSRIVYEGGAGEYRVVVKGFKTALRGTFSVFGECTGSGCVASTDSCDADTFESIPTSTPFTADCAFELAGLLDSKTVSTSGGTVGLSEKCVLRGLERTAIDFYHEYWDDLVGFDDQFRYDPDEDVDLNFDVVEYERGTKITVDAGGDEDGLSMYFDADGKMLAAYQHNQSPTIDYYCAGNGAPIAGPDEDCFQDLSWALPHDSETARTSTDITVSDAASAEPGVAEAVTRFATQAQLEPTDVVTAEVIKWTSTEDVEVVEANILGPDDVSAQYTVAKQYNGWKVVLEVDANGATVVCE